METNNPISTLHSIDDPAFWQQIPEDMKHLQRSFHEARPNSGIAYFRLGEKQDNPPGIGALRLEPGVTVPRHSHDCWRIEIIVQGSLIVDGEEHGAGTVMMTSPNVPYGPNTAGEKGCTTFEICGNDIASTRPILETPQGPVEFDVATEAGYKSYRAAATRLAAG